MLNIAMIGKSNSAKTCFLYAVANIITGGTRSKGYGFKFLATDKEARDRFRYEYEELRIKRIFPPPTVFSSRKHYFTCRYNDYPFKVAGVNDQFTLLDHRGELLDPDSSSIVKEKEKEELLKLINTSNAVIICLEAKQLKVVIGGEKAEGDNQEYIVSEQYIKTYVDTLNDTVSKSPDSFKHFTIIFAITKSDQFDNESQVRNAIKYIEGKFGSYLEKCLAGMIVPVSLGTNFTGDIVQGGTFQGQIHPVNFHLPILFAFYSQTRFKQQSSLISFFCDTKPNKDMEKELLNELDKHAIMYYRGNLLPQSLKLT